MNNTKYYLKSSSGYLSHINYDRNNYNLTKYIIAGLCWYSQLFATEQCIIVNNVCKPENEVK